MQRTARLESLHRAAPYWSGQRAFGDELEAVERVVRDLRRRALDIRTTPVRRVLERMPRVASELARELRKRVRVELVGEEVEVDRAVLDHVDDPLLHLVRNAVDHGLESPEEREAAGKDPVGTVRLCASASGGRLHLSVEEDGRGIDLEGLRRRAVERGLLLEMVAEDLPPERIAELIFEPGMTTKTEVTSVSGRGVGMDAVKRSVEGLGGEVRIESTPGRGTRFELDLPSMVALQRVLVLGVRGERVAVPVGEVEAVLGLAECEIEHAGVDSFLVYKDEPMPLLELAGRIGLPGMEPRGSENVVIAEVRGFRFGLLVDRAIGDREVFVRDTPAPLDAIPALGGVAILPDGVPVFLLELGVLVEAFV